MQDIYVDLLVSNSIQTQANQRTAINFTQNQSQPILKSTNGYKLSIIRFSLNTETLPIFIPTMQTTNTTIYSFTMDIGGVQYRQYMEFEPQNLNPIDPDEYYYVYNYQYVVHLMNKCLSSCLLGLSGLATLPTNIAPTITFDNTSQICTLNLDSTYYGFNETGKINIFLNSSMYALLASIPSSITNLNNGMDYQINNLFSQSPDTLIQNYSTVPIWNPISSIIFTSNLIPIHQSQTPPVQIFENGQVLNSSSTFDYLNVLTDFIGNNLTFTPFVQYSATIYRYLSLKPNSEIRNIDLQVFWQRKTNGQLKNVYLGCGGTASVKLFLTPV